jgi:photosystem II stability/assembly factor-like uncharacterized protein
MRGKFDKSVEQAAKRRRKGFSGGKALQRLFQYLAERAPALAEEVFASIPVPKAVRPRLALTTKAASAPVRSPGQRVRRTKAPPTAMAEAISAAAASLAASRSVAGASATPWQPLGPSRIPDGQTSGTARVDVIGRVACLAVDPDNSHHVLCGAAAGGIWESSDEGTSWAPRTDDMRSLAIGAIAFDPQNPKTVYAGSGEGNFYFNLGAGIYKSVDGGSKWDLLTQQPFVQVGFFDLVVDAKNPQYLYAATSDGFFASTDGGLSWPVTRPQKCWNITINPTGGDTAEMLATFADGLFISTSGGRKFSAVKLPSAPAASWVRLAVGRVTSQPDVVYVFGATTTAAHLWRRKLGAWTKITPLPEIDIKQSDYDWYVAVPPDDPGRVYLGAIDAYRGTLAGTKWTWTSITKRGDNSIHPDQHCLSFAPGNSKILYAGCDGGVFRSGDGGASWSARNSGLGITEIEYLAVDPDTSGWVMAGTQDNGTLLFTGSSVWQQIAEGDGGECCLNPLNSDEIYHTFYWDQDTGLLGFQRSIEKGANWADLAPPKMTAIFYPPVAVYGTTVAIGATTLIVSRNRGTDWDDPVPLNLPTDDVSTALCMTNPDTIFVATKFGRIVRVAWSGDGWTPIVLTVPTERYISSIWVSSADPQRLWVTVSEVDADGAVIYRSDNGGQDWVPCSVGLPNIPMHAVAVDPTAPDRAWAAGDVGVYETRDGGQNWAGFALGLPNAMVVDLHLHAKDRKLVCGTRNRGAWAIAVPPHPAAPVA